MEASGSTAPSIPHRGAPTPLLLVCKELFSEALAAGLGDEDMIAVIDAIAERRSGPLFG